jgi:hypothetical protein
MSLKTKRHTEHRKQEQKAEVSIQRRASRNRKLMAIAGTGAGLAAYFMRTERGRAMQNRLTETMSGSMDRVRNFVNERFRCETDVDDHSENLRNAI